MRSNSASWSIYPQTHTERTEERKKAEKIEKRHKPKPYVAWSLFLEFSFLACTIHFPLFQSFTLFLCLYRALLIFPLASSEFSCHPLIISHYTSNSNRNIAKKPEQSRYNTSSKTSRMAWLFVIITSFSYLFFWYVSWMHTHYYVLYVYREYTNLHTNTHCSSAVERIT